MTKRIGVRMAVSSYQRAKWYAELDRLKCESLLGNLKEVLQSGVKLEKEWPANWGDTAFRSLKILLWMVHRDLPRIDPTEMEIRKKELSENGIDISGL